MLRGAGAILRLHNRAGPRAPQGRMHSSHGCLLWRVSSPTPTADAPAPPSLHPLLSARHPCRRLMRTRAQVRDRGALPRRRLRLRHLPAPRIPQGTQPPPQPTTPPSQAFARAAGPEAPARAAQVRRRQCGRGSACAPRRPARARAARTARWHDARRGLRCATRAGSRALTQTHAGPRSLESHLRAAVRDARGAPRRRLSPAGGGVMRWAGGGSGGGGGGVVVEREGRGSTTRRGR